MIAQIIEHLMVKQLNRTMDALQPTSMNLVRHAPFPSVKSVVKSIDSVQIANKRNVRTIARNAPQLNLQSCTILMKIAWQIKTVISRAMRLHGAVRICLESMVMSREM